MPLDDDVSPVRENHRFDEGSLERYLRERMPNFRGPLVVRQFVGGQSNPTFLLETSDARYVMRKKPPGTLLQSAHAVEREFRIIKALGATDVPVPRVHLLCEDAGVIGTAFFVMDFVEGRIMRDPMMPESSPRERAACYDSMNDVLARLHKVDFRAVGLGDYGRPQAYVARQLARWSKQYEASKIDEIPEMDHLIEWLGRHIPADDETTIAHGDYRIENIIFHPVEPRVVAVLDWELSTLGHPLGDLAWTCRAYHCPPGIDGVSSFQGIDLKAMGIPSEEEFVAAYCTRAGRVSVPDLRYFVAFSFFRGAAISQGIAMRAKMGNASGPDAALRGAKARITAELGWEVAQSVRSSQTDLVNVAEIVNLDAVALSRAIESKQVSCVEVMNAYLDRIERLNPRVNAIVSLQPREHLLEQAKNRDEQLARGECLGWMHGFPHAVKDLEPTRGIRTTMGSPLFKNFFPRDDSILVERIRRAGAILIGKTNVPEFGLGSQTYNPVFGTTFNAYDQSKTCGGSSGGAAVAVALRMVPVADGSDNGGSLRNPAAWNNVFGFRTSSGRVPSQFFEVFTPSISVHGPMARTVPDLAMFLSVIAGYDARTPLSIREDPAEFAGPLERDFKGACIGWVGDFGGQIPFDPGVLELCEGSLKVFEALGCSVETATIDYPLERVWQSWTALRGWQIAAEFRMPYADPSQRALMKPELQWEIENGLRLTAMEVAIASRARTAWYHAVREFFEKYDFMIAPAGQVFPFDAKIHWPKEVGGVSMDTYHRWMQVMIPISMSGCPALSVPAGFNDRGLPMGIQIVGPNHAEMACMQLAHAYDQATNWVTKRPPPIFN